MAHNNGSIIQIFGNLTGDPREFGNSEKPPVNFRVAVNYQRYSSDENGYVEATVYYNCTVFGYHAPHALRLKQGNYVWVMGNHQPREYQDREGNNRTSHDVRVIDMHSNIQLVRRDDNGNDRDDRDDRGRGRDDRGRGRDDRDQGRSRDDRDRDRDDRDRGRDRDDRSRDDRDRGRDRDDRSRDDRDRGRDRDDRDRGRGRDDRDRGRDDRGRSRSDDRPPSNSDDMDVDDLPF